MCNHAGIYTCLLCACACACVRVRVCVWRVRACVISFIPKASDRVKDSAAAVLGAGVGVRDLCSTIPAALHEAGLHLRP